MLTIYIENVTVVKYGDSSGEHLKEILENGERSRESMEELIEQRIHQNGRETEMKTGNNILAVVLGNSTRMDSFIKLHTQDSLFS